MGHSGYAYGLAELASSLLINGKPKQAMEQAALAVKIDLENANEHAAEGVAVHGIASVAAGKPDLAYKEWGKLTPAIRAKVLDSLQAHHRKYPPEMLVHPTMLLADRLEKIASERATDLETALVLASNFAKMAEDHGSRTKALLRLLELPKLSEPRQEFLKALGSASLDSGNSEEGIKYYRQAVEEGAKQGDAAKASALRELAVALDQTGASKDAETTHQQAVQAAEASKDKVTQGSCLTAYGIFLHHAGKIPQAKEIMEKAERLVPADSQYAFYLQNHLGLARDGKPCACKSTGPATLAAMLEKILRQELGEPLAKDLVEKVVPTPQKPGDYDLNTKRAPTDEEQKKLSAAWENALTRLRKQLELSGKTP
jgi:tetratricopeptide (TPR) repeat protein